VEAAHTDQTIERDVGSDHLPVVVDLVVGRALN
jgi:endonuclease/exonuclease/phosphatase (EEP) superfamily protein YafD